MADPTLRLSIGLDLAAVPAGVETTAYLVCRIDAADAGIERERPPLTVMLVLDVSGSMAGPPLEAVVSSVRKLLALLAPADRVGLAVFSDSASLLAPPTELAAGARQVLAARAARMEARGWTNIEDGLRTAAKAMPPRAPHERHSIVLLSDGQPNRGIADADGLGAVAASFRPDVTTTTLGYGMQHSEDVLAKIAQGGGGRYSFVADPQVASLGFAQALGAQGDVVAEAVELVLRPADGVDIVRLVGDPPSRVGAGGLILPIPDLLAGLGHLAVAEVRVKAGREPGNMPLVSAELRYRRAGSAEAQRLTAEATADVRREAGAVVAPLRAQVFLARADEIRAKARALADRGQFDGAAAIVRAFLAEVQAAALHQPGDGSPLSEAAEQLLDEAVAYERNPDAETYGAFRKVQVGTQLTSVQFEAGNALLGTPSVRALYAGLSGPVPDAHLVALGGPHDGAVLPLGADQTLGRTSAAEILVDDPNVSRKHASIVALEGDFFVMDLGSSNTTTVNGERLGTQPRKLTAGDVIQLGMRRFRYQSGKRND